MSYEADLHSHYAGVRKRLGNIGAPAKASCVVVRTVACDQPKKSIEPVAKPIPPERRIPASPYQLLIAEIADRNDISYGELIGPSQARRHSIPRKELYFRLWTETAMSLAAIGRLLNRDHTTIRAGIIAYEEQQKRDRLHEQRREFAQEKFSIPPRFAQNSKLPRKSQPATGGNSSDSGLIANL